LTLWFFIEQNRAASDYLVRPAGPADRQVYRCGAGTQAEL